MSDIVQFHGQSYVITPENVAAFPAELLEWMKRQGDTYKEVLEKAKIEKKKMQKVDMLEAKKIQEEKLARKQELEKELKTINDELGITN